MTIPMKSLKDAFSVMIALAVIITIIVAVVYLLD
jgi:hypothetical protein